MNDSQSLWRFSAVCALLAPLLLLAGDIIAILNPQKILWTILLWLSFLCFVPALAGLTIVIHRRAPLLALIGGIVVLIGTMAGAGMQAYFRTAIVLTNEGQDAATAFLRTKAVIPLTTLAPGIGFPIGLLILSAGLWRSRIAAPWVVATLAIGAVLFPIGHAVRVEWALIAGDLVLLVAFAILARRVISPPMN